MKILGITRQNCFSPNHIGNDAAIFNLTVAELRKKGCIVDIVSEEEFCKQEYDHKVIFNMVRSSEAIDRLIEMEKRGALVINSGNGIINCTREKMTRLLIENNVPHPRSVIVDTDDEIFEGLDKDIFRLCWIKRGDFHAIHREDVSFVSSSREGASILREYKLRGINRAVINEHLAGDLVKFYGVLGEDFFFHFYPFDLKHSKFGLEKINGHAVGFHFDEERMRDICRQAATALDIKVYGGDCIVDSNGNIRIIDFNDWPSFAPCKDEAAPHIANCIYKIGRAHV